MLNHIDKIYAGIGSRKAQEEQLGQATIAATILYEKGYTLRSGGAVGMDQAFEKGADSKCIIFRPDHTTKDAIEIASQFHPAWHRCNDYVRKLMGRNVQIILGENLDSPAEFVLYWCPDENRGGTSHALKVARANKIPTIIVKEWLDQTAKE